MLTAIDTTGDDWWRQVMTEQEHDEMEKAFAEIVAEHESQTDLIEVTFELVRAEVAELIADIHEGKATDRVLQIVQEALVRRYMEDDMPSSEDDRVYKAVRHWMVENDPTVEDYWFEDDDDDDESGWDIDDD